MSRRSFLLDEALHGYVLAHSRRLDPVILDLMDETAQLGDVAEMQIAPEQALLLELLTRAMSVRRAIEVGTFTGLSSLSIARGLGPEGRLVCCDASEEWTAIARRHWERAGVADRIDLRVGDARAILAELPAGERFDLAFVDADKRGYVAYYEALIPRLRGGGVLLADNTLWSGEVVDPTTADDNLDAIRTFNAHVAADERVDVVLLPLADGLTFVQRRT